MTDWGLWVTVLGSIAVAIAGGVFGIVNRRGGEKSRKYPSWVELDKANRDLRGEMDGIRRELDELRSSFQQLKAEQVDRDVAITNVLHDIAQQWPRDASAPSFRQRDLEVLGDTIPKPWRLAT